MAHTYAPAAKANSRRDFLRFLALAPATATVAPVAQSSASTPPAGRYVSQTPPRSDAEVRKIWDSFEWGRDERPLEEARADWQATARKREGNRHD